MGARLYDARLGRWISADTIVPDPGDPQSLNRFSYVRNNPLARIDPSGHNDKEPPLVDGVCEAGECSEALEPEFWIQVETWVDERKYIEFWVQVRRDQNPEDYVLVNFVRGNMRDLPSGSHLTIQMHGQVVDFNFGDWIVDSVDLDPVYWSDSMARWNYDLVDNLTFRASDFPGAVDPSVISNYRASADFQMCLFREADVPLDVSTIDPKDLNTNALDCIDWNMHTTLNSNGTVIYPYTESQYTVYHYN